MLLDHDKSLCLSCKAGNFPDKMLQQAFYQLRICGAIAVADRASYLIAERIYSKVEIRGECDRAEQQYIGNLNAAEISVFRTDSAKIREAGDGH